MEYVLRTVNLNKKFKDKAAVCNINLNVKKGDIYGLIGKNGAGKSTFMKMVCGMCLPTSGKIVLFERDDLSKGRKRIGSIIEAPSFYPSLTAKENLEYCQMITNSSNKIEIKKLLELVRLSDSMDKKVREFSLGMKQRLGIAIALIGNIDFLILDEPINGLDPTGIKEIRELFLELNEESRTTILISSHILGELSKIATRYGVIDNGCLIDEFDQKEAMTRYKKYIKLEVDQLEKAKMILEEKMGLYDVTIDGRNNLSVFADYEEMGEINKALIMNDITVNSLSRAGKDIEEYFIYLMGGE